MFGTYKPYNNKPKGHLYGCQITSYTDAGCFRVYDALELGIIIADGNGTIIWGNRYYSSLAQFDIRDYSVRMCERSPSVKMLYCLQNGT